MTLPATIDVTTAGQVHDHLSTAIASGAPLIIADLPATVFCDAAGADWLHMIGYSAAARNGPAAAGDPARRAAAANAGAAGG
jgi:hypothetical protein